MRTEQNVHSMIKYYLLLFIGSLSIVYILFIRLIAVKLPRELYINISWILISLYIIIIFGLLYAFISTLYQMVSMSTIKDSFIIQWITKLKQVVLLWYDSLITVDNFIKATLGRNTYLIMETLGNLISSKYDTKPYAKYVVLLFKYIPRIIIALIFSIDVILYNKFDLFYKTSCFLLLPLILIYIIYSFREFCIINVKQLESNICILELSTDIYILPWSYIKQSILLEKNFNPSNYAVCLNDDFITRISNNNHVDIKETLLFYMNLLNMLSKFELFVYYLTYFKDIHFRMVDLCIYSLYLICWLYILLYGLPEHLPTDTCNFLFEIVDNIEPFSEHEIEHE
jgi:hypothetical protein